MAGAGAGTVTGSAGSGINCTTGSTTGCSAAEASGSSVTLTASYDSSSAIFKGWSGACKGTGPCVVTMNGAKNVTATFDPATYSLTVTVSGAGAGTVTGGTGSGSVSCTTGSPTGCSANEPNGPAVILTATPTDGNSIFKSWSGCSSVSGNTCTVYMTSAKSVTASFEPATYPLTLTFGGTGAGTVSGVTWGNCTAGGCSAGVANGASVTLSASANAGSTFKGWGIVCTGTGTCTIKMNGAKTVSATFSSP